MTAQRLALGAMLFGTTIDEATSFALLDSFVDAGGEWIDTADCYSFWTDESGLGGQSERVLGRWLAARPGMRDRVKISTKFGAEPLEPGSFPDRVEGLGVDAVRRALEGSLRRLGTDHVDISWAHMEDRSTPIESIAGGMAELVSAGLTVSLGFSNHPTWRVERARQLAPVSALQHSFSYLHPRPLERPAGQNHRFGMLGDEHLDYATETGLEVWAYTPLLGGAYDSAAKHLDPTFAHAGSERRLAALTSVASDLGVARGQVVLAWLVAQGIRPILGGSKLEQLDSAIAGVSLDVPRQLLDRLDV